MNSLCVKKIYNTVFHKMFVVFYTVNLYICVFMTYSAAFCLYDTIMDAWNVCIYVKEWHIAAAQAVNVRTARNM
jgi:hypothetical protein